MPDNDAGGNGQAPTSPAALAGGNGQAPTPAQANNTSGTPAAGQNGQAPTATQTSDPTYAPPSADEWKRTQQEIAEARRDAAKYRDELKKRDDAQLTADQKRERDYAATQARALELELRVQQQGLELAGHRLAAGIGIADAGAAIALVLAEHAAEVQYDEKTGVPGNLADLLKAVLKDHPILAAHPAPSAQNQRQPAATSGGATNPGRQAGNGGLSLEVIRNMPMRERMARLEEITAWEKAQRQNS